MNLSTAIVGLIIVGLVALAIRHIVLAHKKGGCCGNCDGCQGCNLSYEEVKKEKNS
ncbi:MAG: FeoB-associated Cys-rich membrane protein [Anaerovoracaceae bacterium]